MMSKVNRIIENYFRQQPSENVRYQFYLWLKDTSLTKEKDEVLHQLWDELSVPADSSTEKSYEQVEKRLGLTKRASGRLLFTRLARIAAIFLIPLLSVLSVWLYVHSRQAPEFNLVECFVPNGEIREVILPDKSRVLLNSGSSLFYQEGFSSKIREVYLSGEAKFTVSPDKQRRFVVKTNDMSVEALGTVFNVSSYPDYSHTTATLVEGKIGAGIRPTGEHFILNQGEQLIYDKITGQSLHRQVRLDYVLAWEKGQLVFLSASLSTIIKELERRYGVTVYLNDTDLSKERLTVKFLHNETIDEILHALQQIITGFEYKTEGDKIYIY